MAQVSEEALTVVVSSLIKDNEVAKTILTAEVAEGVVQMVEAFLKEMFPDDYFIVERGE